MKVSFTEGSECLSTKRHLEKNQIKKEEGLGLGWRRVCGLQTDGFKELFSAVVWKNRRDRFDFIFILQAFVVENCSGSVNTSILNSSLPSGVYLFKMARSRLFKVVLVSTVVFMHLTYFVCCTNGRRVRFTYILFHLCVWSNGSCTC